MRFLLISLFCFALTSCASYSKKNDFVSKSENEIQIRNPYFAYSNKDYVYKANLTFYKKKFSGIIIVKKIADHNHRVVYTTEMGNKIFDFSFIGDDFTINHIIPEIDKKIILNTFQKDFYTLIKEYALSEHTFTKQDLHIKKSQLWNENHYYFFKNQQLLKIVRESGGKEKVVYDFSGTSKHTSKNILITHKNIKFNIKLKAL